MAINFEKALGIHEQALRVRGERAQVLANNLANSDTPGFQARDIDFKSILQGQGQLSVGSTSMKTTSSGHMAGQTLTSDTNMMYRTPTQPSIDGNTVEEQVEHAQFMENGLAFQASFTFLNSKFTGLMSAIRGE
jgi:flagellar basal-body rod protein FlgB